MYTAESGEFRHLVNCWFSPLGLKESSLAFLTEGRHRNYFVRRPKWGVYWEVWGMWYLLCDAKTNS